ncbi:MFS general substrate transporter [Polyplosphaeria fusca]|uniref:MFS general substrate transporter n=1 Tax=Polyplosphaeria fusca TaxID=682080 RepID=A0A9P4QRD9_9PLEO|nr:MFS general substrate transporter [Polyplosphaeria fusca]
MSDLRRPHESDPLLSSRQSQPDDIVCFSPNDPEDPRNWSSFRKWLMVAVIMPIDFSVSWGASGFSPAVTDFVDDMGVSREIATLGLSLYILGLAFGPMTLAPLSEYFGRRPIYVFSYAVFLALLLASTYIHGIVAFLILRIAQGYFSSVTISNFGGTIADLFYHHDTGPAMSLFLWAATGGSPTGFVLFSFIAQNRSWRDTLRIMFLICLVFWVLLSCTLFYLGETRHNIILMRRARDARKSVDSDDVSIPDEFKARGPKQLFGTALTRPFKFLSTEAIVQFSALYNGYLYGLSFLFNGAFHIIFGPNGYGFDTIGVGLSFLGICLGITSGLFTNLYQERYYQRQISQHPGQNVPEARVYLAHIASPILPISLFVFALTATPETHPIIAIIASAFWGWSFYTLILMTLTYTEDAYQTYSASALAGIGLVRNIAGAAFPVLGRRLFLQQGTRDSCVILASMAVVMVPIPWILTKYGRLLRQRSPWASEHSGEGD